MDRQTVCLPVYLNTTFRVRSKGVHVQDCPVSCTCSAFTPNGFGHWRSLISPCCLFSNVVRWSTRAPRGPVLTLDKIVLSVTLLAPLCLTLTVQAAALGQAQSLAITREHRCCCTVSQPTRKRRFAKVLQPTRKCRFATLLSCSPHAGAGLHPGFLQPTHSAG